MEDIKLEEKVLNQKIKGIFTIIATILINMIIGNSLIWLYLPEKADYYFDDKPAVLETLQEQSTKLYVKDHPYNQHLEFNRINDWAQLRELY